MDLEEAERVMKNVDDVMFEILQGERAIDYDTFLDKFFTTLQDHFPDVNDRYSEAQRIVRNHKEKALVARLKLSLAKRSLI